MDNILKVLNELISYETEREWFEFKENWFEPAELGKYISALSNSAAFVGKENGFMVWGVNDKTHEITGTTFDFNCDVKNEPLKHFLSRQIFPDLNFWFDEVIINGKRVVVLTIPAASNSPTSFDHERYIRIGSSKEILGKYPGKESYLFDILRHGPPSMENRVSDYQDLTFEKLMIYYGAKGLKLNPETFKKNLSLLTMDGKYNILAQILSDDSHIPIRVAIFSGKSKADKMFSVREFGFQCILYSLDEVLRYGDVLNIIQADETNRIVERKEVPLFDYEAFREAIVNAFVHNCWIDGNEPMITVYSDRIEILSRGTLPPGQTMEGFFAGESVPVNKKLSEIFLQLHISEKTGRGIPRITSRYGNGVFEFREKSIVVTIPFNWINTHDVKSVSTVQVSGTESNSEAKKLSNTQMRILEKIRDNPNIRKVQMASDLGLGKSTIDKGIAELKKAGLIEHVGSNKNGYWKVL